MAKCSVRLKDYKSNKAAYVEIMDSGAVQALCEAPARAIAAECNATFTKGSSELIHNRLKSALDSRKQ